MTRTAASIGGITLLERAVNYTQGSLHVVTGGALSNPTPCRGWDLRALLVHLNSSLRAMNEAVGAGQVGLVEWAGDTDGAGDLVARLRSGASQLLGACAAADRPNLISVAGRPLTTGIVTSAGALEIAVHGWDVARACGWRRPLPSSLAEELLELSPLFITAADRSTRFAAPVATPPLSGPADRLVAFLGRRP